MDWLLGCVEGPRVSLVVIPAQSDGEHGLGNEVALMPKGKRVTRAFVTHVSSQHQPYEDAAIMLGLSLRRHGPNMKRIALVERHGAPDDIAALIALLERAAWHVLVVPQRRVPTAMAWYYDGIFAKIEVFRLPVEQAVYMDADTWVLSGEVSQFFDTIVGDKLLAMVVDTEAGKGHQAGVIALRTNLTKFELIAAKVSAGDNDQRAINNVYSKEEIRTLPPRFNVHGSLSPLGSDAVVVHFTGHGAKPSAARVHMLQSIMRERQRASFRYQYVLAMASHCCFAYLSADLQQKLQQVFANTSARSANALGQPRCFEPGSAWTFQKCCDPSIGPNGDLSCWDGIFDFRFCCRPPAPLPRRITPGCWGGSMRHLHEVCCYGGARVPGPRGEYSCWSEPEFTARRCCAYVPGTGAVSVNGLRPQCLSSAHATTCSYPSEVIFRAPPRHFLDTVSRGADAVQNLFKHGLLGQPVLWSGRGPQAGEAAPPIAHFVVLGVGGFDTAARRVGSEAGALGIFSDIHVHTDFTFVESDVRLNGGGRWRRHMEIWHAGKSRIAGFGWWKPALCRRHIAAVNLPDDTGFLVFSDAGNRLWAHSKPSWKSVLSAMVHGQFDILAVLDDFVERSYTKRRVLERFLGSGTTSPLVPLRGTAAGEENQFTTRLFVLRKTAVVLRLLELWEDLVSDIGLVDETLHPDGELQGFVAHRHEQSIWSLLLKCAILGRSMAPRPGSKPVNLTARVLTLVADVEGAALAQFARSRAGIEGATDTAA